jgi:CHAT domain-containing protein/tetratricopeptide (TPR) repeat protein
VENAPVIMQNILKIKSLLSSAYSLAYLNEYDKSIKLSEKILKYCENSENNNINIYEIQGLVYENLGFIYYSKGYFESAIRYFKESLKTFFSIFGDNIDTARIHNHLGNTYLGNHNYFKAIEFFKKSIYLYQSIGPKDRRMQAIIYNNLGAVFGKLSYTNSSDKSIFKRNAIKSYLKSLSCLKDSDDFSLIAKIKNNLGVLYTRWLEFDKARIFIEDSINNYSKDKRANKKNIAFVYHNYGELFFKSGDYNTSRSYIKKSLSLKEKKFLINLDFFRDYRVLAEIEIELGNYFYALKNILNAINSISYKKYKRPTEIIDPSKILIHYELIHLLFLRANTYTKISKKNKNIKYLSLSHENYKTIFEIVDKIRKTFNKNDIKELLSINVRQIFENSLNTSYELFTLLKSDEYPVDFFSIMDRSKGVILFEEIQDSGAKEYSGIPDYLIKKENELKVEIGYLQKTINNQTNSNRKDNKISELENKLFYCNQKLEELWQSFEKNYKDYYDLKYNYTTASISDIQSNLADKEILIEYFLGEQFIFIFKITKDDYSIKKITKSKSFDAKLRKIRKCLTVKNQGSKNYFEEFVSLSHYFYKLLLKDAISEESISKLIIIPDGMLNFIPFEVLITEKPHIDANYRDVSYLLEKYDVRYSYSSTLFLRNNREKSRKGKDIEVLGFAPSFKRNDTITERKDTLRSGLAHLKWNVKELKNTGKYFKGSLYTGSKAGKKVFIEKAGSFPILHLATHGIVEDQNPMYSKIAFTQIKSSLDDGYLHTYELYNMNVNSDLTILSACDTGYGKLVKGEGVMSIARGFIYAGSRSIMMSLWQVSDFATCKIIDYFYKGLSEGMNKDEALRKAKLKYLRSSDSIKSNPAYWAPFVLIGNNSPLT